MRRHERWLPAAVIAATLVLAWAWQRGPAPVPALPAAQPAGHAPRAGPEHAAAPGSAPAEAPAQATAEAVRARLFRHGSLVDTQPAGGWCVVAAPATRASALQGGEESLQPCAELRLRFDHYLLGLGEADVGELRSLVADDAQRAHGSALAAAILSVWDRYLRLGQYPWSSRFDPADRNTWTALLAEQRQVRRQILGEAWASAFYAEEEQHFEALHARLEAGAPAPLDPGAPVPQVAPGKDPAAVTAERVARYGEAAAQRLAQVDADWADWERRLAAARAQWQRLQQAGHLSDPQRNAEMAQHLRSHFRPDEHLRVKALLRLPEP
jgi:lipase chaperone LimK